jgi:hypothetical protein
MFESIPSYFSVNISTFILLAIFLVAIIISYLFYRRTVPPISKAWRIFLGSLRAISLAAVGLLLFTPELTLIWQRSEKINTIFLVDRSASMGIKERGITRIGRANALYQDLTKRIKQNAQVTLYAFDVDTSKIDQRFPDTTSTGTDIYHALEAIIKKEKNPDAVILISDGNFTSGDNPLYADFLQRSTVYTVGLGDTVEVPDLLISDVKFSKLVYQGKSTPVEAEIMIQGMGQSMVSVILSQNNKILDLRKMEIEGDGRIYPVPFEIIPDKLGLNRYEVKVEGLAQEAERNNNRYVFNIEVLKGKIQVGLVASQPNLDVKFIRLLLTNMEDVQVNTMISKRGMQSYIASLNQVLDSLDVLVLHDFPVRSTPPELLSMIDNRLKKQKVPTLIIVSQQVTGPQVQFINKFFPLKSVTPLARPIETQVTPSAESGHISILNVFDNLANNQKFWLKCPPIKYPFSRVQTESGSKMLLQTRASFGGRNALLPVLQAYNQRGRQSLLLLGSGFWRWHFLLAEQREFQDGWKNILRNMVRWLSSGDQASNVIVTTAKKEFQVGESVHLKAQVYDGSYNAVTDGLVRFQITGPSGSFEVESELTAAWEYAGKFVPIADGNYQIEAKAWLNDVQLGQAQTEISVTPVNNEFTYTRQDYRFLKALAEKSGGKYFSEQDAGQLLDHLDISSRLVREEETFDIWNKLPMLLVIIILLSIEWFFRKRKGLA